MSAELGQFRAAQARRASYSSPPENQGAAGAQANMVQGTMEALNQSLLAGKYSDLKIIHGEQEWTAHKVVVFSQSNVLEAMAKTPQGGTGRDNTTRLDLSDHDYEAVTALLEYFYSPDRTYTVTLDEPVKVTEELVAHARVVRLAINFQIAGLETLAAASFEHVLHNDVKTLNDYVFVVHYVYTHSPPGHPALRHAVAEMAASEMTGIMGTEVSAMLFHETTSSLPEYQRDVLAFLVRAATRNMVYQLCDDCGPAEKPYRAEFECAHCGEKKLLQFK